MVQILSLALQFTRRYLFFFILIVLLLAGGRWATHEWAAAQVTGNQLAALESSKAALATAQAQMVATTETRIRLASGATTAQLDAAIVALDAQPLWVRSDKAQLSVLDTFRAPDKAIEALGTKVLLASELELRRQAREQLKRLRTHAYLLGNRQAALRFLEQLRLAHSKEHASLVGARQQLAQARSQGGIWGRIPYTPQANKIAQLEQRVQALRAANSDAQQAYAAQHALLIRVALPANPPAFSVDVQRLQAMSAPIDQQLSELQKRHAQHMVGPHRLLQAFRFLEPFLLPAACIVLGALIVPALLRTLAYFVLAPLASRRPSIVLGSAIDGGSTKTAMREVAHTTGTSSPSRAVPLKPEETLLVRPDFAQSLPAGARVVTHWLFDWRYALTSIAANLWMLRRITVAERGTVVLSSTSDPLDEIALVDIVAGGAFIVRPGALVGVRYASGAPPRIRSYWRLTTLHAWLTFQLRYLALEGPATLVLKGCRGVRLEHAGSGRTISQDATIGFSIDAQYRTIRAEPFAFYLFGRQPLFYDRFDGTHALFIYEEVPRSARPDRRVRGPLGVLVDAGLKAFGL